MGEAKRKRDKLTPVEQHAVDLTRRLANEGKLLAGGFGAYCMNRGLSPDDPRVPELHDIYMAGAEHLWTSMMAALDPGIDETPGDMKRMDDIQKEIDAWRKDKMDAYAQSFKTKGSA